MEPEDVRGAAEILRSLIAEVDADRIDAEPVQRIYLAGVLDTLDGLQSPLNGFG